MNEILLAFVTFVLGILATVVTQFFNRKFQLQEQRQQRRTERLADVENWINSYRSLFQCKYPQLQELALAHRYVDPNFGIVKLDLINGGFTLHQEQNKEAFEHICKAMREFKAVESKHKAAEKEAIFALRALGANSIQPNLLVSLVLYLRLKVLRQNFVYFVGDGFELWYPKGFLKEIASHLSEIKKQKDKLFHEFPSRLFYNINWEILDNVQFEQFSRLLLPRHPKKNFPEFPKSREKMRDYLEQFTDTEVYTEDEIDLLESLDSMEHCRQIADREIDNALLVIEKYKTEWL